MDDPHPPRAKWLGIAFISTFLLGSLLLWIDQFLITQTSPHGIVSFELAKNIFRANDILSAWGPVGQQWAWASMLLDFPFLAAYTALFILLANRTPSDMRQLFVVGFMIAGFCDLIENLALVGLLSGIVVPPLASAAYYFACLKFLLLATGLAFLISQALLSVWRRLTTADFPKHQTAGRS